MGRHHCRHIDAEASDPGPSNRGKIVPSPVIGKKNSPPLQKSAKAEEVGEGEEETLPKSA